MNSTIKAPKPGLREMNFSLDPANGIPIYRQLIQQIEYAVLSGRVKPGDRLPTIRSLSVELRINPNTIAKAYNELEIRGMLVTQVGNGTFISDKKPRGEEAARNRKIRETLERFIRELEALGVSKKELAEMVREKAENKMWKPK
ncbi:MAG: GntR family transcriptional regulator [Spirochaetaceae bacterium]|jgi:GntR family transcriptional regulator|nr:GntR family transcriptional regulator [Spirochaetaceae bacterium]